MIQIRNIYYMLSYAFQILKSQGYKSVETEEFDNIGELFATILVIGVSSQIKRGLEKGYLLYEDSLSSPRGKIDISSSIKSQSMIKRQLVCSYDEFSANTYMNRVIRTTMDFLLKTNGITKETRKKIRKVLVYFADIDPIPVSQIDWKFKFNKNNQTYRMLMSVCYLTLEGLIQSNKDGTVRAMDFIDEQRMSRLYEKFILEYYRKEHPEIEVSSSQIPWDTDGCIDFLPVMQSDIMLKKGGKVLIIDAKFYSTIMQRKFDTDKIRSGHLYQIFAYVKNMGASTNDTVSGMLLYAKTEKENIPDVDYKICGSDIMIKTLDLDCDFSVIKSKLDGLLNQYLTESA